MGCARYTVALCEAIPITAWTARNTSVIRATGASWPRRICQTTTDADTTETRLTPKNVNVRQFGHRFRIPEDGDVYAQPLILPHLRFADVAAPGTLVWS